MDWRGVVTENWPYKLAAVVLALLLWLNVTAEERQEFPVATEVQVELQDEEWVVVDVIPDQVRTVFQGRRGLVMPRMPVIRQVVDSVTGPRMELSLSPRMVRGYDQELNLRPVAVRPSAVELRLEPRISRRVPVEPRLDLSAAAGFSVLRPVLLQPDTVTLRGAESEVSSVQAIPTEEATLEDLRRTVTRELQLRPPEGLQHLEWSPERIVATVEVDSIVERSVRRPVALRGEAADAVLADRDSVEVTLRGPGREVSRLSADRIRAFVSVDSLPPTPGGHPVELEIPEGLQVTAAAEPSRLTLRPRGAGGGP